MRHLGHAQASAVCHAKRCAVLDARRRLEQPPDLLDAQHLGQSARIADQHQASQQIRTIERYAEQEAQRRYRVVDGGRTGTALVLVQLGPSNVLGGRGIG